jgi:hypothetical protein
MILVLTWVGLMILTFAHASTRRERKGAWVLSSIILATLLGSKPDFPHLTILQRVGDKLTYLQARETATGKLESSKVWTIDRPGLRSIFPAPGISHLAVILVNPRGRSFLEVLTHTSPPVVVASATSSVGFSYDWIEQDVLEVADEGRTATIRLVGGAWLRFVQFKGESAVDVYRVDREAFLPSMNAINGLKIEFPLGVRGTNPVGDRFLMPRNGNPVGGFDQGLGAFALTILAPNESVEVRLYWQDAKRTSIRLRDGWPQNVAFGGGLVGLLYGDTCYLYSARTGEPLGSLSAESIG